MRTDNTRSAGSPCLAHAAEGQHFDAGDLVGASWIDSPSLRSECRNRPQHDDHRERQLDREGRQSEHLPPRRRTGSKPRSEWRGRGVGRPSRSVANSRPLATPCLRGSAILAAEYAGRAIALETGVLSAAGHLGNEAGSSNRARLERALIVGVGQGMAVAAGLESSWSQCSNSAVAVVAVRRVEH